MRHGVNLIKRFWSKFSYSFCKLDNLKGAGKTTYTFSTNANVLSANFPFSVLPAGGAGMGQVAETKSMLALAENVYVNLPTP